MAKHDKNTQRLKKRLRDATGDLPPTLVGMSFVRHVPEGNGFDAPFAWAVYVSHDPCHDGDKFVDDRNTVIALYRKKGVFKILGRELPANLAYQLARGEF
jgi:hypothetical protein